MSGISLPGLGRNRIELRLERRQLALFSLLLLAILLACYALDLGESPEPARQQPQGAASIPLSARLGAVSLPEAGDETSLARRQADGARLSISGRQLPDQGDLVFPELEQIRQLQGAGAAEAIARLGRLAPDTDVQVRLAAVVALAEIGDPGVPALLVAALQDPSASVRLAAIDGLAIQADAGSAQAIEALLWDTDAGVRRAALEVLTLMGSEVGIDALAGLLGDRDVALRRQALHALSASADGAALGYLEQALFDPDPLIRAAAAYELYERKRD